MSQARVKLINRSHEQVMAMEEENIKPRIGFRVFTFIHLVSYAGINQIRFNGIHIRDLSLLIKAPRQDMFTQAYLNTV